MAVRPRSGGGDVEATEVGVRRQARSPYNILTSTASSAHDSEQNRGEEKNGWRREMTCAAGCKCVE